MTRWGVLVAAGKKILVAAMVLPGPGGAGQGRTGATRAGWLCVHSVARAGHDAGGERYPRTWATPA